MVNQAQFNSPFGGLNASIASFQNGSANDLYLKLSLPEKYGWGAVGIGNQMSGSLMFVIYASSNSRNTTLSTRSTMGHNMPTEISSYDCRELDALVQTSNIESTFVCYGLSSSPRLSTSDTSASFIWAVGPNQELSSDSTTAAIQQHTEAGHGTFSVDMTTTSNLPGNISAFVQQPYSGVTSVPLITGTSQISNYDSLVTAHATLLGGSYLLLFPLGVVLLHLLKTRVHYIWQLATSLICVAGLVIAVVMSRGSLLYTNFDQAHQIMGILSVSLLAPQIVLGVFHHLQYMKIQRKSWVTHLHLWFGRVAVVLGMITGVLGFKLAGSTSGALAYGIIAAVVAVLLSTFVVWKRRGQVQNKDIPLSDRMAL